MSPTPTDAAAKRRENKERRAVVAALEELGGKLHADDSVVTGDGPQLVLPRGMSVTQAIRFLMRKEEEDGEETAFVRTYPYRPWDGAVATYRALRETFGSVSLAGKESFFGKQPPAMIDVPTGANETTQAPWGNLTLPILPETRFNLGGTKDEDGRLVFRIVAEGPRRDQHAIQGVFALIEERLRRDSIYRGKAIDGAEMPGFLDLDAIDPERIVYTDEVTGMIRANILTAIRHADALRENGVPLKRSVLLYGPYGTGKTLAGFLIAREAVENGWTYLYVRPGRDDVYQAMDTAAMYAPAVVFVEDVDTFANPELAGPDAVSELLDRFDGVSVKGREVMVVLTTNHPERLHKGLLRPGRLDAVIEVADLDAGNVRRLIERARTDTLDVSDWDRVTDACLGFTPAFVREAADRAYRLALTRNGGDPTGITLGEDDLVLAAHSLRHQLRLMDAARADKAAVPTVDAALRQLLLDPVEPTLEEVREYLLS